MRVGRLTTAAEVLDSGGKKLFTILVGINDNDAGASLQQSLQVSAVTKIRARWCDMHTRYYLKTADRLFVVTYPQDPDKKKKDLIIHCHELRGFAATVYGRTGSVNTRCWLSEYRETEGDYGGFRAPQHTQRKVAEFPGCEYEPAVDDEFLANGARWKITEHSDEGCVDVVRRVWVDFLGYEEQAA